MAMNKGAKLGLVIGVLVIIGVGGYFGYKMLFKPKKEEEEDIVIIPPPNKSGSGSGSGSGGGGGGGANAPTQLDTKVKITEFQNYVINTKKDTSILGKSGADGIWGNNSQKAWDKYGTDYTKSLDTKSPTNQPKASKDDIAQIISFADKSNKTTESYLSGSNQNFVKEWAKNIRASKTAFIWANQVYRTKTGVRVLDFNPTSVTLYANKSGSNLVATPSRSASRSEVNKNEDLGKGSELRFADGYLYIKLPKKNKWIASIWISRYKVNFSGDFDDFMNDF